MFSRRSTRRQSSSRKFSLLDFLLRGREKRSRRRQLTDAYAAAEFGNATESLENRTLLTTIVDIASFADGDDGVADSVEVAINGSDLDLTLNGNVVFQAPLGDLTDGLRVNGSGDDETLVIAPGIYGFSILLYGNGGADSASIDGVTISGTSTSSGVGLYISDVETVAVSNSTFNNNPSSGLGISRASTSATFTDVTANGNQFGLLLLYSDNVSITNGSYNTNLYYGIDGWYANNITINSAVASNNGYDGMKLRGLGALSATNVTANNNDRNGLYADAYRTMSITGGTYDNNDADNADGGNGIDLSYAGHVTTTSVTATGNDTGILISGGMSYTDTDGNFSNNNDGGIVLIDIADDVSLTRTTISNNNADSDVTGDGFNAADGGDGDSFAIGGQLVVNGLTAHGTYGTIDQQYGLFVESIGGHVSFDGSKNAITVNGNQRDGISIDNGNGNGKDITFTEGNYDGNRHGIVAVGFGTVLASDVEANNNAYNGMYVSQAVDLTVSGGTFNSNGYGISTWKITGNVSIDGSSANGNYSDGILARTVGGNASFTNVTADGNGRAGGSVWIADGNVTISGGTYNNNGEGGIKLSAVSGRATTTDVIATGNASGILMEDVGSYTDTDGNYSDNNNGGIQLIDIAGDVSLTRTTINNNDADNNNVGDGLNATDGDDGDAFAIGSLIVNGLTAQGIGVGNQEHGLFVELTPGSVFFDGNVDPINVTGNDRDGVQMTGNDTNFFQSLGGNYSSNGTLVDDGINLTDFASVNLQYVTANSNDGSGVELNSTAGSINVNGGTFNDNDANDDSDGDGVSIFNTGGEVNTSSFTALRNDAGVLVSGAAVFRNFNGNFSNNDDHGIQLIDIAGGVTLTRTIADNNDDDNDGTGDGLNATDGNDSDTFAIGGQLIIRGARFRDTDGAGNTVFQQRGVSIAGGVRGHVTLENDPGSGQFNFISGNNGDGFVLNGDDNANVTISGGHYLLNGDDGIRIDNADAVSLVGVDASSNGSSGLAVDAADSLLVQGGRYVANGGDGMRLEGITAVTLDNLDTHFNGDNGVYVRYAHSVDLSGMSVNGNDGHGLNGSNITGTTTIDGGDFSSNGDGNDGDGIHLRSVGDVVTTTGVTATGNGPGIHIDTAASYTDIGGNFSGNDDDGLRLIRIAGNVTLTGTTANDNGGNGVFVVSGDNDAFFTNGNYNNNAGDGISIQDFGDVFQADVTATGNGRDGTRLMITSSALSILRGTYNSNRVGVSAFRLTSASLTDVDASSNNYDGALFSSTPTIDILRSTFNSNSEYGVVISRFTTATLSFLTTNNNGNYGADIASGSTLNVSDWVTMGNNADARPGNVFDYIETVNLTTTSDAAGTDDKIEIFETDFQHTRALEKQDVVGLYDIGMFNIDTGDGTDVFVLHENAGNTVDINLDGGTPSTGGDKLVMADSGGTAAFTDPATGTGVANNVSGNAIDFTGIDDIVAADAHELNESLATATDLGSDTTIRVAGSIHRVDDEDYFQVTADKTGVLQFNLFSNFGTYMDLDLQILDVDGNLIAALDSTTDDEYVAIPVIEQTTYFVRVYGKNSNGSGDFSDYDLEIENTPLAITPPIVGMDPGDDSGMMNNDNVTNDATPRFLIQADLSGLLDPNNDGHEDVDVLTPRQAAAETPGFAVWVQVADANGNSISGFATQIDTSDLFSFTPSGSLIHGVYSITSAVSIIDVSTPPMQDQGPLSDPLQFTIDTIAPSSDAAPNLLASSDTGMKDDDNVTSSMRPVFSGTQVEADATVRVFANDVLVGQGMSTSSGDWQVTVDPLTDGVYTITTEIEDLAGNISPRSNGLRIVVDAEAPDTPLLDLLNDTGRSATDNITSDNTPEFTMTSEDPNIALAQSLFADNLNFRIYDQFQGSAEVLIYDSATDAAVDAVSTPGDMFTSLTQVLETLPTLADGVHNLKLEVEDRAGNINESMLSIEIDTQPLNAPMLTGPTGTSNAGAVNITWEAADRATGYDLLVYNMGTGQQVSNPAGISGESYATSYGAGIYQAFVRATNSAQTSSWSTPLEFELAAVALETPTLTGPTGSVAAGNVTITWNAAAAAAEYDLLAYNINTGQEVANFSGLTGTSKSLNLAAGKIQVFLRAGDGAGTTTAWSTPLVFDVTGATLEVPTLTGPVGSMAAGDVTITWVAATGAADYDLLAYNMHTGQEVANFSGLSETSKSLILPAGKMQVFLRAGDGAGTTTTWGTPLVFDVTGAVLGTPTLTGPAGTAIAGSVNIGWTAADGASSYELLAYNMNTGQQADHVVGLTGNSYSPPAVNFPVGSRYQVFLRAVDASGNVGAWGTPVEFDLVAADSLLDTVFSNVEFDATETVV